MYWICSIEFPWPLFHDEKCDRVEEYQENAYNTNTLFHGLWWIKLTKRITNWVLLDYEKFLALLLKLSIKYKLCTFLLFLRENYALISKCNWFWRLLWWFHTCQLQVWKFIDKHCLESILEWNNLSDPMKPFWNTLWVYEKAGKYNLRNNKNRCQDSYHLRIWHCNTENVTNTSKGVKWES